MHSCSVLEHIVCIHIVHIVTHIGVLVYILQEKPVFICAYDNKPCLSQFKGLISHDVAFEQTSKG